MAKALKKQNFKGISQEKIRVEIDFLEKQETQVLGDLSITSVKSGIDFSFRQTNFDSESIKNPNIIEKDFADLKANPIDLKDKFDDISDPLFDLDDAREYMSKTTVTKKNNLTSIARRVKNTKANQHKRSTYK